MSARQGLDPDTRRPSVRHSKPAHRRRRERGHKPGRASACGRRNKSVFGLRDVAGDFDSLVAASCGGRKTREYKEYAYVVSELVKYAADLKLKD